ncbi:hypothetical protein QJS04_geneDACA002945 [Acorus gramineus]|uniref:Uncharacterized protein n=1 Tax=Acorus gramineus TaxID=55184 RepID=A0AAV9BSH9_ACOGR|nr:hypothetical protein QJS04_geneDACA002945 [Acorus gramineus]
MRPSKIFITSTLLFFVLIISPTQSREIKIHGLQTTAGEEARAASEEVVGLTRASEFAPPAPRANINPDPSTPIPLRG